MPSPFAITTTTNTVSLDSSRQGQASFTVSNSTRRTIRGHASIVAQPASATTWLTLLDEAERSFAGSGSQQYAVQIAIPTDAKTGEYTFQLNVADLANPDESFSEGPLVSFTIEEPTTQKKKPFPWWIVVAIIGGLILVGGAIYSLTRVFQKVPAVVIIQPTATPGVPRWLNITPMPTARAYLAAVLGRDGRIYTIGGNGSANASLKTVEIYNPYTNSWTSAAPLPTTAPYGVTAVLGPDGRIYAMGGLGADQATVEVYDPKTNTWSTAAPMPTPRIVLSLVLGPDGRIYAIGGYSIPRGGSVTTVEVYDPQTNTWSTAAPMPTPRNALATVLGPDGRIYAIGGYIGVGAGALATVEAYNPQTNTWSEAAPMPTPRAHLAAVLGSDKRIYVLGGGLVVAAPFPAVNAYDSTTNTWSATAPMPRPGYGVAAVPGPDGRIYVLGGYGPGTVLQQAVEIYDPGTNSWAAIAPAPTSAALASAIIPQSMMDRKDRERAGEPEEPLTNVIEKS